MEFIEGLILGFFGGVVPPLLILIMTNDEKARAECLNSTNVDVFYRPVRETGRAGPF